MSNAFQSAFGGAHDAFVAKLSADGRTLLYSTYLGGSDDDIGYGIALDSSTSIGIAGATSSPDSPQQYGLQSVRGGGFFFSTNQATG